MQEYRLKIVSCIILLAPLLWVPGSSSADTYSLIAGAPGTSTRTISQSNHGATRSVSDLEWWESADQPCSFRVAFASVQGDTFSKYRRFNLCNRWNRGSYRAVKHWGNATVEGMRVCLNKRKTRIKGIRWFRIDGSVTTSKHPNCNNNNWSSIVKCPGQYTYTPIGFKFHYTKKSVSGIQFVCP